jgi:hypothetical protein
MPCPSTPTTTGATPGQDTRVLQCRADDPAQLRLIRWPDGDAHAGGDGDATATRTPTQTAAATATRTPPAATATATRTPTQAAAATATQTAPASAEQQTVTFDDLSGPDRALTGQYPTGVTDWGSGGWWLSSPWGAFSTKSISFVEGGSQASFSLPTARRLVSLRAYNGESAAAMVALSCAGQPTVTASVGARQVATLTTGWMGTCASVTVATSNGWGTNFDDIVIGG